MKRFITTLQNNKTLATLTAILFWVAVWQVVALLINQRILLVGPFAVANTLFSLVQQSVFWRSVINSMLHIIGGFFIGLVIAFLLAYIANKYFWVRTLLSPFMVTIKNVPVASFIILLLFWLGSAKHLAIVISFLMVLPVLYTNVLAGFASVDKKLLVMADVFNMPLKRKILHIVWPSLSVHLRAGCTIALGLCWKSGVAAEVIGVTENSIGGALYTAKIFLSTAELLAWTVVIVVISVLFEKAFLALLSWLQKASVQWI